LKRESKFLTAGYLAAFWMLGDNIDGAHWPNCGEIDIMGILVRNRRSFMGLSWTGLLGWERRKCGYTLPSARKFSDDFHTFAVEWEPNVVRFYVDGLLYKTRTPADLPTGTSWVFDHPSLLF